jgi:hypothetical protein
MKQALTASHMWSNWISTAPEHAWFRCSATSHQSAPHLSHHIKPVSHMKPVPRITSHHISHHTSPQNHTSLQGTHKTVCVTHQQTGITEPPMYPSGWMRVHVPDPCAASAPSEGPGRVQPPGSRPAAAAGGGQARPGAGAGGRRGGGPAALPAAAPHGHLPSPGAAYLAHSPTALNTVPLHLNAPWAPHTLHARRNTPRARRASTACSRHAPGIHPAASMARVPCSFYQPRFQACDPHPPLND